MKLAFDSEQANFHGISDASKSNSLFISKVIHRAVIDVNEAGTEAAAATAVLFAPTSAAIRNTPFIPEFNANRPFLFLIRNNQTGLILFMGQYTGT
jgi:serpin B